MDKSKVLFCFDMDDTLFAHDPYHIELFARMNGHNIDENTGFSSVYRSFELFKKGDPITGMIDLLAYLYEGGSNVIIVTARDAMNEHDAFMDYLLNHGIDCPFYFAGANKKHDPVKNKFAQLTTLLRDEYQNIEFVHMFDDSYDNIQMLEDLKKNFPNVTFYGHHFNVY